MKWTRAEFDALPDVEREDLIAFDLRNHQQIGQALEVMSARIRSEKAVDGGAFMTAWLAYMGI